MVKNKFLDHSVQKAFMSATPSCVEHHCKLATILAEARKKHKSLAVSWLDLEMHNNYGNVHHSLIQFSSTIMHLLITVRSCKLSTHTLWVISSQMSGRLPLPPLISESTRVNHYPW